MMDIPTANEKIEIGPAILHVLLNVWRAHPVSPDSVQQQWQRCFSCLGFATAC
jgi:hypothetical protein